MTRIPQPARTIPHQRGVSLIELMIGIALGLIIVAGMASLIANTSRSRQELAKTNQQIENGRYAMQLLADDIRHAGFYGDFVGQKESAKIFTASPAVTTDPCDLSNATVLFNMLQYPVQGANEKTSGSPNWTNCPTGAAGFNVMNGTDILVVRHAHREAVCNNTGVVANDYYLQSEFTKLQLQRGAGTFVFGTTNAAGTTSTMCKFYRNPDSSCGTLSVASSSVGCANAAPATEQKIAATIRKFETNIYFIAPCNNCASNDGVPTLKRLVLGPTGFTVQPLVDNIENMQVEYGVDSDATSQDGSPDTWVDIPASTADLSNVTAVRVHLLARNNETTTGYTDNKTYVLGTKTITGSGAYKRHVFSSTIQLKNMSDRRTLP